MYTIDIHHKGDKNPSRYHVYKKSEAQELKIQYK